MAIGATFVTRPAGLPSGLQPRCTSRFWPASHGWRVLEAALEYFGVPDADRRAEQYAAIKHEHVLKLIEQGRFRAFPDALRFILAVKNSGIRVAAASSSKNAKLFLERIRLDTFTAEQRLDYGFVHSEMTLEELFDADISGRDLPRGKPDPLIFLTAAEELGLSPRCVSSSRMRRAECRRPRLVDLPPSASPGLATSSNWPTWAPTWW